MAKSKELNSNKKVSKFKYVFLFVSVLCVLIILYPFIPAFWYWLRFDVFDYDWNRQETFEIPQSTDSESNDEDPNASENTIVIPAIGVNIPIVEGSGEDSLSKGAWHRPGTGDPESGGNMVITGHRFQYLPPNNLTFYHLNKVEEGDDIIVYWNKMEYDYVVVETFVVNPEDLEVEEETAYHVLTLYTCTPLWTADKRLVVRAEPVD